MIATRTLIDTPAGEAALVAGLTGGGALASRLACLGFIPGTQVTPIRNAGRGPVIVLVRDTRVALGRVEAANVLVHVESDHTDGADGR